MTAVVEVFVARARATRATLALSERLVQTAIYKRASRCGALGTLHQALC